MTEPLAFTVPPELIEVIARRAAELVAERLEPTPWMTRRQAAEYLALPLSHLEKDRAIPRHHSGGRVLYHRAELDGFMRRS
jgi:excisionase family DNA binding protein